MDENRVRAIFREEMDRYFGAGRVVLPSHLQMMDGRNIQTGRTTGTKIGTEADQKIGFFGATPVIKQNVPATTPDAQDIIDALVALGLLEQSD